MKYCRCDKKTGLSWQEYKDKFRSNSDGEKDIPAAEVVSKSKQEKAYETACDTRKFEINLYWHRAAYFWAFITTIYVAYYHVLVNIYCCEFGHLPLLVLSGLGLFFAVAWILVAKGSRHWQENWETHVSLLEDDVTGPLFKIHKPKSFSVSKVNLHIGYVVAVCAGGLYVFEIVEFCKKIAKENPVVNPLILFLTIFVISTLEILTFVTMSKGNVEKEGPIELDEHEIREG